MHKAPLPPKSTLTPIPLSLIKRHGGPDAAIVAAQRADELLASGDRDGQAIWKRIVEAILELLRKPQEDDPVN